MGGSIGCWQAVGENRGDWEFGGGMIVLDVMGRNFCGPVFAPTGRSELCLVCSSSRASNPGRNMPGSQPAYAKGVVPFIPTGWVEPTQAEWDQVHGCGRRARPEGMSTIYTMSKPHMPPVRPIGTTLSGLLAYPKCTHVIPPAVQPWALWQNPFRIPGGERGAGSAFAPG
jgi:hypothetical protein